MFGQPSGHRYCICCCLITQSTEKCGCCFPVAQSCPALCDPMDCSVWSLPAPRHLLEFSQVHVSCIGDAIQPSHPLMPSSPFALNLSQHQGLFPSVSCSHQVTKILELQLQHQPFQWVFRVDFLKDWLVWTLCCPRDSHFYITEKCIHTQTYIKNFHIKYFFNM